MLNHHDFDALDDHGLAPTESAAPGPLTLIAMPRDLLFPVPDPGPLGRGVRRLVSALKGRFAPHQ